MTHVLTEFREVALLRNAVAVPNDADLQLSVHVYWLGRGRDMWRPETMPRDYGGARLGLRFSRMGILRERAVHLGPYQGAHAVANPSLNLFRY
ncbi:hypothetical protein EVAR_48888_1 [Eumeta japonica]|uniref:Uncharacterized protein n=1 Tax=Eumeta variegata TaxID=151549 RepID=A0A4C1YYL0_EUMVA|nr:hypothetical protein EVAR_48888_1 [Eumeta japonica]